MNYRTPVFLIGAGRSGTKFLRACLSASDEVDSVPYDIGYVWRFGNETVAHDELVSSDVSEKIRRYIVSTLPTLTSSNKPDGKFLIEKSVPNALRISFINEVYPDAKFVHLVRDGRAVIESSIRQWRNPVSKGYLVKKLKYFPWKNYRYAIWFLFNLVRSKFSKQPSIWGPRYKGIMEDVASLTLEEVCAKQWSKCVDLADTQFDEIDACRIHRIQFEDLMGDVSKITELCAFIGIKDVSLVEQYFLKNVDRSHNAKSLGNLDDKSMKAINKYAKETLLRLGYL